MRRTSICLANIYAIQQSALVVSVAFLSRRWAIWRPCAKESIFQSFALRPKRIALTKIAFTRTRVIAIRPKRLFAVNTFMRITGAKVSFVAISILGSAFVGLGTKLPCHFVAARAE